MRRVRSIGLVALRELLERGRSRSFILALLLIDGLIIGSFVLQAVVVSDRTTVKLGTVGEPNAALTQALQVSAKLYGLEVRVTPYADVASAEVAVKDGTVGAALVPASISPGAAGAGQLLVKDEPSGPLQAVVQAAFTILSNPAPVAQPSVVALSPRTLDQAAFVLANAGVILLFMSIVMFGQWVLTGVVEEKQSRVVEVVLATVRPRDLLIGKVLGIGALGLFQILVLLVTGLVVAGYTGGITLPQTAPAAIAMTVVWFVIGYLMYAAGFAAVGALTSRMEEASNATLPVLAPAMVAYFIALLVIPDQPDGLVARIVTLLPPSAPIVIPMRAALGAIAPWEVAAAVVLSILAIWGMFVLGGRVYMGAILRLGPRVGLRDAWRSAEE
jgi:ABC-2 type transport system permease protein